MSDVSSMVSNDLLLGPQCRGRALYAQPDGTLYISRGYTIFASRDDGATWHPTASMPVSASRRLAGWCRLGARLLRYEVRAMAVLKDGTCVAANREGVFRAGPGETQMSHSAVEEGGVAYWPPSTMTAEPEGCIVWGEYGANQRRRAIRVYVSQDQGRTYSVGRTFSPGEVRHVHNVVYDRAGCYWVLAGDHDDEPGIGRMSLDFTDFEWVVKGKQIHRAVGAFDFGDYLVYGTDTEMEPDAVMRLDKQSGRLERIAELDGSCIYSCQFGGWYALTTSVEPSVVNRGRHAGLWLSRDGERWERVFRARKDRWNAVYFQFGSLILPRGVSGREAILFSGQAVDAVDNWVTVARVDIQVRTLRTLT